MTEHTSTQDAGREDAAEGARHEVIHYSVNGEPQETTERKLTVREILTNAGFTPAEEHELTRDKGHKTYTDFDEEVPLHEGEKFTATFTGPTPVS